MKIDIEKIEEIKILVKEKLINFKNILIDVNHFKLPTFKHKLIIYLLILPVYLVWFIMPNINYAYNKINIVKYNNDDTSCMLHYVNNHYPKGAIYYFDNIWDRVISFVPDSHIDGRLDKEPYLEENFIKDINWCMITDSFISFIYNTPYCYITLMYEKGLKLNKFWNTN